MDVIKYISRSKLLPDQRTRIAPRFIPAVGPRITSKRTRVDTYENNVGEFVEK